MAAFIISSPALKLAFALIVGIVPALFWLWFWLKEDRHPEPRSILIGVFSAGMLAVFVALALENASSKLFSNIAVLLTIWAFIEESVKYLAAKWFGLRKSSYDEPVDAVIYLITAALGFAALENVFFLIKTAGSVGFTSTLITGNLRFLGATLLHTAASATLGASIAFSFFNKKKLWRNVIGGLALATMIHFLFNYFILTRDGSTLLTIFIPLWVAIIAIILLFERVKRIRR